MEVAAFCCTVLQVVLVAWLYYEGKGEYCMKRQVFCFRGKKRGQFVKDRKGVFMDERKLLAVSIEEIKGQEDEVMRQAKGDMESL